MHSDRTIVHVAVVECWYAALLACLAEGVDRWLLRHFRLLDEATACDTVANQGRFPPPAAGLVRTRGDVYSPILSQNGYVVVVVVVGLVVGGGGGGGGGGWWWWWWR